LITGAVGAATSLAGAKMASSASKNAARMQSAAADKALAVNERVYRDQQALFNPYVQGGTQALAQMQQMAGGMPQRPGPQQPMSLGSAMGARPMPGMAGAMSLGSAMAPQRAKALQAPTMDGGPQAGGMVLVASPDGSETMEVPRDVAQQLVARGGQIVSGR
jgi:hypothetical protein